MESRNFKPKTNILLSFVRSLFEIHHVNFQYDDLNCCHHTACTTEKKRLKTMTTTTTTTTTYDDNIFMSLSNWKLFTLIMVVIRRISIVIVVMLMWMRIMMIPVAFSFAFALANAAIYNATATCPTSVKIHPLWICNPHFDLCYLSFSLTLH